VAANGSRQAGTGIGWGSGPGGSPWGRELVWDVGKGRGSLVRALYGGGGLTEELISSRSKQLSLALLDGS
jgi:hypothetical protein